MSASTVTFHRLYGCLCSITIKHELRKSVELANVWDKEKAPAAETRALGREGPPGVGDAHQDGAQRCKSFSLASPGLQNYLAFGLAEKLPAISGNSIDPY